MKIFHVFKMLFIVGSILSSQPSFGKDLVVGVFDMAPFFIIDDSSPDDLKIGGIDAEIINEIAARLKVNVRYEVCPWPRCLQWMESGELDIMTYLSKKPEREKFMLYIEPSYLPKTYNTFYVTKDNGQLVQDYEDLYKFKHVGVVNKAVYFSRFDNDSEITKYKVHNNIIQLNMLKENHLEIIIGQEIAYDYLILTKGFKDHIEKAAYKYEHNKPDTFMAISKKSPFAIQIKQFNQIMKELVEEGIVADIKRRFLLTK